MRFDSHKRGSGTATRQKTITLKITGTRKGRLVGPTASTTPGAIVSVAIHSRYWHKLLYASSWLRTSDCISGEVLSGGTTFFCSTRSGDQTWRHKSTTAAVPTPDSWWVCYHSPPAGGSEQTLEPFNLTTDSKRAQLPAQRLACSQRF